MVVKRIFNLLIVMIVVVPLFSPVYNARAKTIANLKSELTALENKSQNTQNQIIYTEKEINNSKNQISNIYKEIDRINDEIVAKNKEIEELNKDISNKEQEIKDLINFFQISSGESSYLEYLMGSKTLTDFIYRLSIVEQLSKYNSDLINQMNEMILKNEQRKVDLKNKEGELETKQVQLSSKVNQLGEERAKLYEYDRSLDDEIKVARDVIDMYVKAGCGENEEISVCANRLLPPDTKFWRPQIQGYITSEFGYRKNPLGSGTQYHPALDMSNSDKYNTKIYAVASGKVAKTFSDKYGGNQVVIHHRIFNGSTYSNYTSTYLHLAKILVKDGDLVTKDTAIGIMGTTGNSTGPHLHLSISTGHRYKDYVSYSDYISRSINPRTVINFPSYYVYWNNRTSRY